MRSPIGTAGFDSELRGWVLAACREWSWSEPSSEYYAGIVARLPEGLRTLLASGLSEGLIVPHGWRFTLKGLPPGKGPYQWFSERRWENGPHPNWEYFVHVAEFVRVHRVAVARDLQLNFEDDRMDLALYEGDVLLVCFEAKERADQLRRLIAGMRRYEPAVDMDAPDRHNDGLKKAKYIVRHRPGYFCGVAIGTRLEYRVDYPVGHAFRLAEDQIPWL
jgi:hypothetical protein